MAMTLPIPITSLPITLAESGWIPDALIRLGIRKLVKQRLREEQAQPATVKAQRLRELRESPVALHTDTANEQHYEVPTGFFQLALGARLKYSACIFPKPYSTLDEAELHTLKLYRERMDIQPGQRVLDLGCGWGSFTLWLAEMEPHVHITAVSNSVTQREFILGRAKALNLKNVDVITGDVNELELPHDTFDRAISVEMFEHVRNYATLMARISGWLKRDGVLFTHIFCHKEHLYPFEVKGEDDWMSRYFFTGGLMPAVDTLTHFQDDLALDTRWVHDGRHYERTARAWLENMDRHEDAVVDNLRAAYGDAVDVWQQRWRMFFMACEEMFAYDRGREWQVAHYRFRNKR